MEDESHHLVKFLKKMEKSENPKENECLKNYKKETTKKQRKKQRKACIRKDKTKKICNIDTPQIQNKKQKNRIPRIRERSHKTPF